LENHETNDTSPDLDGESVSFSSLHLKLDEFIAQLADCEPDRDTLQELRAKFNDAIGFPVLQDEKARNRNNLSAGDANVSLGRLVIARQRIRKKNLIYRYISLSLRLIIGLLLILLGFGMIIMPAPQYFEMFTLFYLNPNDGVTIMDIISLIVVFAGIIILIGSLLRFRSV